ncbi:MAG: hypothetical protein B0A82_07870 [Alkalinema sp. CACIAM 70d]|nr:MAG: hypothetical protein B0A82_07870 [Alkalinema sp. CACIAM 70d]
MKRRNFLQWFGLGGLMVNLPTGLVAMLSGCKASVAEGFRKVGSIAELDEKGFFFQEYFTANPLLVVRQPKTPNTLTAVDPICTHQGCVVNWQKEKGAFVCPCHGAVFSPEGKVLQGPADRDLPTYPVELRGQEIWVSSR